MKSNSPLPLRSQARMHSCDGWHIIHQTWKEREQQQLELSRTETVRLMLSTVCGPSTRKALLPNARALESKTSFEKCPFCSGTKPFGTPSPFVLNSTKMCLTSWLIGCN